ncbi:MULTISPECIES: uroporphyrinogen-III synthase [Sphingomonas]|uniref:uroporphyrinogen-III synthase n=1 Tax=Sphingomonas TaxID=13687 RepID=UPI00083287B4|nr:uroporphyrinogen-III synthase [Sphingomonas sp. CCH10-B3]
MTRRFAVLRPEPGNAATCARLRAGGHDAIALSLFEIVGLPWTPPDPADFDALVLTSANAVRAAGPSLAAFMQLPTFAVGAATARAATAAGMTLAATGDDDAEALIAAAARAGVARALHLGGRETRVVATGIVAASIAVYASDPLPVDHAALAAIIGATALVHSPRAAERLRALVDEHGLGRGAIAIAALSPAVAQAAGSGWARVSIARQPSDAALIEAAVAASD